ncbi:MAG: formyltransferase family protein [Myxococcota bacterium]
MGLRLLFAGVAQFALQLLDAGHELGGVALPYLDDEEDIWALLSHCTANQVPVWPGWRLTDETSDDDRAEVAAAGPYDVLLVMSFDRRIGAWARELGQGGAWNLHPSLLPRHRGYNPYYWTIRSGDPVAGVTLHHLEESFDTGHIILQQSLPVSPTTTSGQLWEQLNEISVPLVVDALEMLEHGDDLPAVPQDETRATHAPKPRSEHLELDVRATVDDVLRAIRAATPQPGPLLTVRGLPFIIRGARPGPLPPRGSRPGDYFLDGERAAVVVRDGSVVPLGLETLGGQMVTLAQVAGLGGAS